MTNNEENEENNHDSSSNATDDEIKEKQRATERKQAMRIKFLNMTGKKPPNIPVTKKVNLKDVDSQQKSFFGDRRPNQMAKLREQRWLELARSRESEVNVKNLGKVTHQILFREFRKGLHCLKYSPDGETLVLGFDSGLLETRLASNGDPLQVIRNVDSASKFPISNIRFHPLQPNKLFASSYDGCIYVSNLNKEEVEQEEEEELKQCDIFITEENTQIENFDIDCEGTKMSAGNRDGSIKTYDMETGEVITEQRRPSINPDTTSEIEDKYHKMRVFGVRYHPQNPSILVTGGWDDTVKVWDSRMEVDEQCVLSIQGPHICGDAIDIKNDTILTGSWRVRNSIELWNLETGELINRICPINRPTRLDGEFFYNVQFFKGAIEMGYPEGDLVIAGGSGTGRVEVISIQENTVVASFPSLKSVTALDSYMGRVAYGGMESTLRIGECELSENFLLGE